MDQAANRRDSVRFDTGARWGWPLVSAIVFSAAANLLMLTGPLFLLLVYERVIAAQSAATLVALVVLVAGLFTAMSVLDWARARLMSEVGAQIADAFAARASSSAQDLQLLANLRHLTTGQTGLAVLDMPWTPLFLLAIFALHPWLGWLALFGGTLVLLLGRAAHWITARSAAQAAPLDQEIAALTHALKTGRQTLRAMAMDHAAATRWQSAVRAQSRGAPAGSKAAAPFIAAGRGARMFLQSAMLAAGAALALWGEVGAGAIFAATILMGRALGPFEVLLPFVPQIVSVARATRHDTTPAAIAQGAKLGREIVLSHVNIAALHGPLSMRIPAGRALAIQGPAGSGKSALARVIAGASAPLGGQIHPLSSAPNGAFAVGQLGYAAQTPQLMIGPIAHIIARGAQNPDLAKVRAAARLLGVDDAISAIPEGFDAALHQVAPSIPAVVLRQIALARAFYEMPPLLVLDEPEQGLDPKGLDRLCAALATHRRAGGTLILVSHHPALLAGCDQHIQLEQGRITAQTAAPVMQKAAS